MGAYCISTVFFFLFFKAYTQNYKKQLLASSCLSIRPSILVEQLGSQWLDFQEILFLRILSKKSFEKIQVSLKSDKNKGYLYLRNNTHFYHITRFFLE